MRPISTESRKYIESVIMTHDACEFDDVISHNTNWEVFYHLSSLRGGLLGWYPFRRDWKVLVIGDEYGCLAESIASSCGSVHVMTAGKDLLSKRLGHLENVCPCPAAAEDASGACEDTYDCVIAVDVFGFNNAKNDAAARRCFSLLKDGGLLLAGYVNPLGVRYLCGGTDDTRTIPFEGLIEDIDRCSETDPVKKAAEAQGFSAVGYYYPYPDEFFPQMILTDECKGRVIRDRVFALDEFAPARVMDEDKMMQALIDRGLIHEFSNYYIACYIKGSSDPLERKINWAVLSADRGKERGYFTVCFDDDTVEKRAIYPEGTKSLREAAENVATLEKRGIPVVPSEEKNGVFVMPLIKEESLLAHIENAMSESEDAVIDIFRMLERNILLSSDTVDSPGENFEAVWKISPGEAGPVLREGFIDMIPYNAFWTGDSIRYYDQEFKVEECPAAYVMFRALMYSWIHIPDLEKTVSLARMKQLFGLERTWNSYSAYEYAFVRDNRSWDRFAQVYRWAGSANDEKVLARNRARLLPDHLRDEQTLKKVHGIQLELLRGFVRVCDELGLRYFMIHGTLLGAVRHQGFIPWDDDVDIAMPREDYDILTQKAASLLAEPFWLQTMESDLTSFYGGYSRLRHEGTVARGPGDAGKKQHGIWIDILPVDSCPPDEKGRTKLQKKITFCQRLLFAKNYRPESGFFREVDPEKVSFYYILARFLRRRWIIARLERLFKSCGRTGSCSILACYYRGYPNRNVYSDNWLADLVDLRFEDLILKAPAGYDLILKERYGEDYMSVPGYERQRRHPDIEFEYDDEVKAV